jgi:hypothetical protein
VRLALASGVSTSQPQLVQPLSQADINKKNVVESTEDAQFQQDGACNIGIANSIHPGPTQMPQNSVDQILQAISNIDQKIQLFATRLRSVESVVTGLQSSTKSEVELFQ